MIWLSSFPRSGNTFLRNILFEVYGIQSSTFHREDSYPLDEGFQDSAFVKTHLLPSTLVEFDPTIPAVYLVRDGRDALCSIAHHRAELIAPGTDYRENLRAAIIADQGSFFGGWSTNAEQWLDRADLIIRYEDLIQDPVGTVERIRTIYALPNPDLDKVPTFEGLKSGIAQYGSRRDHDISEVAKLEHSDKFFRRGIAGGWKDDMPDDLQDLFWSYHGETMERLGYSHSGEVCKPNPDFDSVLLAKLGERAPPESPIKRRILIESDKIVSPDNDGVKRYQVELLNALIPVVENVDSRWEIDLYIHGQSRPLLECRGIVQERFFDAPVLQEMEADLKPEIEAPIPVENRFIKLERDLVALVPRRFVRYLAKHNISILHRIYEAGRSLFLYAVGCAKSLVARVTSLIPNMQRSSLGVDFESYDLVHIPLQQHFTPFKGSKVKKVVTIHDLTHLYFPDHHTPANISNAERGMQFVADSQADLIAISQSTRNDILGSADIAPGKVHLIYEAADRNKFNPKSNAERCRNVREKYGLDFDEPYIICLSTLEPRKNLKNTIESYILLRRDNPGIPLKLVIAGKKGWKTEEIFSAAEDCSAHIYFTDFVDDDDLAFLYSGALALSYLSLYEGFGLPPLEAMCCGTPVIYGNNSSMIEIVDEGGLAADPNDLEDIKSQYERIFYDSELRELKSRAALKQSIQFSWRKAAIETLELYERIIDGAD